MYLATNSDTVPYETLKTLADSTSDKLENFAERSIWTGRTDLNLDGWTYIQRSILPAGGIEPKLQVVGDSVHYEYFGKADQGIWQVFTASSRSNGVAWRAIQRTRELDTTIKYRVEQSDNIQVVGDRVYFAYPRLENDGVWQLVSASYRVDGSDYRETLETSSGRAGSWVPTIQVWRGRIYYLYPTSVGATRETLAKGYDLYFASSDLQGGDWKIIKKIASAQWVPAGWGSFTISKGIVYFIVQQSIDEKTGWSAVVTGAMTVDGENFTGTRRSFEHGFAGPGHSSIQVLGDKAYYVFDILETERTSDQWRAENGWRAGAPQLDPQSYHWSHWTAESNADGSAWDARQRARGSDEDIPRMGYKSIAVVGAKQYFGGNVLQNYPIVSSVEVIATCGANVVNKGDAFGIGLTERGTARAFINAGQDYLYRGESPYDTSGQVADSPIDSDRWHNLLMTYDRANLRLYIDGQLHAWKAYSAVPSVNPFPLVIGDGFQGVVDEVSVYDRALTGREVRAIYDEVRGH